MASRFDALVGEGRPTGRTVDLLLAAVVEANGGPILDDVAVLLLRSRIGGPTGCAPRLVAPCPASSTSAGLHVQGRRRRRRARSRSAARPTCPRAVPTAATAATGGDVWLVADRNVASLLAFRDHPHRRAENGTHGTGKKAPRHVAAPT